MNLHSLRFQLIGGYAALLTVVLMGFGGFAYYRLDRFLCGTLQSTLEHRAVQIAQGIVSRVPSRGEAYAAAEIEARYAPASNDKFVRVTRPDASVLYLSSAPNDHRFVPGEVPAATQAAVGHPFTREQRLSQGGTLLISAVPQVAGDRQYLVEVGSSLAPSRQVLHTVLLTLAAGLPLFMAVAILGGFFLMKRALAPVDRIMRAARDISLHHLSRRLPVAPGGDEIASLSHELNQMIARLDESFKHTSRFTADASHELRTPLAIIHGELEAVLLSGTLTPELRDGLGSLLEEVERLVRIVESLFALARLDTGEAQGERVRFDLAKLVDTTAEQMCLLAEEKRIVLTCNTPTPVEVEGDRTRLKQVVVNLLDNAIKFTPRNGRVSVTVRGESGSAALEVADTGPGVSVESLPHLFERFYRCEEVRTGQLPGAGLGLSIVHSICAAHSGSVRAENLREGGCQVTVGLPLAS